MFSRATTVTEHVKALKNEQQKCRKMNTSRGKDAIPLWHLQSPNSSKIRGFGRGACGDDAGSASQPARVHFSTLLAARQHQVMSIRLALRSALQRSFRRKPRPL